jgi:hypothetical protein
MQQNKIKSFFRAFTKKRYLFSDFFLKNFFYRKFPEKILRFTRKKKIIRLWD